MSILSNISRIGNFTSSEIYNLTKLDRSGKNFGVPALTYIEEKNMERRLLRSLDNESNARPLTWGKMLESFCFAKLGFDYELTSSETICHADYPFWWGSPDGVKTPDTVFDIKCPITLKSFCQLVDDLSWPETVATGERLMERIRLQHKDGEKYYWQLVSNAILTGSTYAELIVYVPYLSDLEQIKQNALALDEPAYKWIGYADDLELPYLIEGGYYNDVNIIRFEVPQSDIDLLTGCVERAGKMLVKV